MSNSSTTAEKWDPVHCGEGSMEDFIKVFEIDSQFWLNLQTHYELELAEDRIADQTTAITPLGVA